MRRLVLGGRTRRLLASFTLACALLVAAPSAASAADPCYLLAWPPTVKKACDNTVKLFGGGGGSPSTDQSGAGSGSTLKVTASSALLTALAAIPDYTAVPGAPGPKAGAGVAAPPSESGIKQLQDQTTALALALLSAVATVSMLQLWLTGMTTRGGGGIEAADGLIKALGAGLMILAWPTIYSDGILLANNASHFILTRSIVSSSLKDFPISATLSNPLSVFSGSSWASALPIFLADLASAIAVVIAIVWKIILDAITGLLAPAAPIGFALLPLGAFGWVPQTVVRAATACLIVPLIWALLWATWAVLGVPALSAIGGTDNNGFLTSDVLTALTGFALLLAAIRVPRAILMSSVGPAGRGHAGFLARAGSYAIGQRINRGITSMEDRVLGPRMTPSYDPATGQLTGLRAGGSSVRMYSARGQRMIGQLGAGANGAAVAGATSPVAGGVGGGGAGGAPGARIPSPPGNGTPPGPPTIGRPNYPFTPSPPPPAAVPVPPPLRPAGQPAQNGAAAGQPSGGVRAAPAPPAAGPSQPRPAAPPSQAPPPRISPSAHHELSRAENGYLNSAVTHEEAFRASQRLSNTQQQRVAELYDQHVAGSGDYSGFRSALAEETVRPENARARDDFRAILAAPDTWADARSWKDTDSAWSVPVRPGGPR